ncbi:NUDIX domain-containing protein [Arsenicicoccus dermatophilus]|uniref:NUDIX domain-containing protein n=1 Tax=Arsenicicoccus dermatophilus TaxID=1076331 RepID=UPI0039172AF8
MNHRADVPTSRRPEAMRGVEEPLLPGLADLTCSEPEPVAEEPPGPRPLLELSPPSARTNRVCACVVQDGRLLVVERRGGGWTLPGGGVQRGESRMRAAARETYEQAGAVVEVGSRGVTVTGTTGTRSSCFPAIMTRQLDSPEGRAVQWVDPAAEPWCDDPQVVQLRERGLLPTLLF